MKYPMQEMCISASEILWIALGKPKPSLAKHCKEDMCCLCGRHKGNIRAKDTWSNVFTNVDLLRYPESEAVCIYCYSAVKSLYNGDVEVLYKQIGSPSPDLSDKKLSAESGVCAFCGVREGNIKRSSVRSVGFIDSSVIRKGDSQVACRPCYAMSNYSLRTCSWIASKGGLLLFRREDLAAVIFMHSEIETPFVFYVTTSQKKLGQIKVQLNSDYRRYKLLFEEIHLDICPDELRPLWDVLSLMYSYPVEEEEKAQPKTFFTKVELVTGNYQMNRIRQFGLDDWRTAEAFISQWRGSGQMSLLIYILTATKKGRSNLNGNRGGGHSRRPNISSVARDSVGQRVWFTENENI